MQRRLKHAGYEVATYASARHLLDSLPTESISSTSPGRGHRVFVDAEVVRGGPLLEVTGARQRKLGEPRSARLL
jgi:hypothetical protein